MNPTETIPETVAQTFKRGQAKLQELGSVSAKQLANPVSTVTVPQPQVATIPQQSGQLVTNITRDNSGFIAAKTAEADQLRELQGQFGALNEQGSLSDLFNTTRDQFGGGSDSLKELKDIQLQLTDMNTGSKLTKTRIEGAAGQTLEAGQRQINQQDREAAVRSAGLAARASVIQGNIQTANAAAKSAVDIAYQDRTLKSTNLLNQISMVQDKVDQQTAQLLETEKRGYEAALAALKELKDATQNAIVSGATQAEVSQMLDANVDDATKLSLAQSITARGATQMRNLDIEGKQASIAQSRASTANIYDQISARGAALRQAQSTATTEQSKAQIKATADTEQALGIKQLANELLTTDGLSAAIGVGFKKSVVGSLPFVSGDAISGSARADFEGKANRLANLLTLDNLKLMSGVLTDRDIQLLATAGSNLGQFNLSETAYKSEINRVIGTMDRTINNNGITTEQAVFFGTLEETDAQNFDVIWDNL